MALRLLGELVVVFLGVLVALWVDAWVGARGEREAQRYLLASLAAEVEANAVALDSIVLRGNEVVDGMRTLLEVHTGSRSLPRDSLQALLLKATSYWRSGQHGYGVAFGVYDAMVATGSAQLLPTQELGLRLANHRAEIEKGQGDESYAERAFEDVLRILRQYGGWYSLQTTPDLQRLSVPPFPRQLDLTGLLGDPAFAEALFSRILWESNIMTFYANQVEALEETLGLVVVD